MEEGMRHAVQEQNNLAMSQYLSMTAEVSASHGDLDVAVVHARQALELGHIGQRLGESAAYRSLAVAESQNRRPDWAKITEWMRISFESAEQRNELPTLLIDRIRYAEILHKRGELESAKAELDRAEPLIQQLGMNWWPQQAQSLRRRIESGEPFRGFIPYLQDGEN